MQVFPELEAFDDVYTKGEPQVVWTKVVADLETPVSAYLKLAGEEDNSFLLESVEGGAIRGRYSFIGVKPDLIWRCMGNRAALNRNALTDADAFEDDDKPSLESLRSLLSESEIDLPESLPPMSAGLFGYMSYDTIRLVERIPDDNPVTIDTPDGLYIRPTVMAIFDAIEDTITIVTPVRPAAGTSASDAYSAALERLDSAREALGRGLAEPAGGPSGHIGSAGTDRQYEPGRLQGDGRPGKGIHTRRRYLSGRAQPAVHDAIRVAAVLAVPGASTPLTPRRFCIS